MSYSVAYDLEFALLTAKGNVLILRSLSHFDVMPANSSVEEYSGGKKIIIQLYVIFMYHNATLYN